MSVKQKLIINDPPKWKKFVNALKLKNTVWELDIGIFEEENEIFERAMIHEFGSSSLPSRSFIRTFFKSKKKEIDKRVKDIQKRWALFNEDPTDLINELGKDLANMMRKRLVEVPYEVKPPLQPGTIQKKEEEGWVHPEAPLVRTGDMMDAIDFKIRKRRKA